MKEFAEREKERTEDRKNVERARRKKEAGWVALEVGRGEEEGGNLPASSVRAFLHPSCPSFGCFHGRHLVGSFTPGRRAARARARERERVRVRESDCRREGNGEESAGRRTKSDGGGRGEGGLVETR